MNKGTGYRAEYYTPPAKRKRFLRVAERRTNRVLDNLRLLSNCSNRNLYIYEQKDIEKIFTTIRDRVDESEKEFNLKPAKREFHL